MLLRMAGRVLFVYFSEIRWAVIIVKEAVLHPFSASYVDVETGKLVARYPASSQADRKRPEKRARRHQPPHRRLPCPDTDWGSPQKSGYGG